MIRENKKTRTVLYARFSSDNQRSESIDAQIRAMKTYCKQHHLQIVETYIDEAKSATTDRRPAFQQMIADSKHKLFDIVLVHKLDRFARNRYDSAVYKKELKKNGVAVYSVLENLDDSPESIMMEAVLEGMSEYFSYNLSRETMKGMKETALQCKHTGGTPPLGYDVDPHTKKLILNEAEAQTVRLIFDLYNSGNGYTAIIRELNSKGLKTKNGSDFAKNSLRSILTNPKYKGTFVFNRSAARKADGTRNGNATKIGEDWVTVENGCPQIIDSETFDHVQRIMQSHKHSGGRVNAKQTYLLSGKVFCKECGRAMVGNTSNSGRSKLPYITYRCPNGRNTCRNREISKNYLEQYVISILKEEMLTSAAMKRLMQRLDTQQQSDPTEEIKTKLEELETAIANVTAVIEKGMLSEALLERLQSLEDERHELQKRLFRAENEKSVRMDADLLLAEYRRLQATPNHPEYKKLICSLIDRISVGKYTVDIRLKTGLGENPDLDQTYTVRRQVIYQEGRE